MDEKQKIDIDGAYSLESAADNRRLYDKWAATYDADFVDKERYVAPRKIAAMFAEKPVRGPVLDVGCGTGSVGIELRKRGVSHIVGVDISDQMLAVASGKKADDGTAVYQELISADLTQKLEITSSRFSGIISAGTFTHGHLGPDSLNELWRVAAPGAHCVIGIRTTHFDSLGFRKKLDSDVAAGRISVPMHVETNIYASSEICFPHAEDKIFMVSCKVL